VNTIPPIRKEVLVDAGPAAAFDVFTAGIGRWWPVAGHSVHGAGGTVVFTGGQIVEESATGQRTVWGTVTRWEPPAAVAFTWHPGQAPERTSHVEVTFAAAGAQTLVTLVHSGWESFADPAAARANYDHGWPIVLGCYQEHTGHGGQDSPGAEDGGDADGKQTWVALH
jgi:Activator of Hsp90 ATPase homolog 1-like protein